jgi:hypothetical protein
VAHDGKGVGVFFREELKVDVFGKGCAEIDEALGLGVGCGVHGLLAGLGLFITRYVGGCGSLGVYRLHARDDSGGGEAGRDGHRDIVRGGAGGELFDGAIWEVDLDLVVGHGQS